MSLDKLNYASFFALFLLFTTSNLPAQTSNKASITTNIEGSRTQKTTQEFISYIGKLTPGQKLSDEFVAKYLGTNPNVPIPGYNKWYFDEVLAGPSKDIRFIIVKTEWPEGIGKVLYSFTTSGRKIDWLNIYSDVDADAGEGGPSFKYKTLGDSVIEVRRISEIFFENTITKIDVKYYDLRKDGKFVPIDGYINLMDRKYPELSDEKLSYRALKNKSAVELWLMRNEIFAAHGQIFKTENARHYFKSQKWYFPQGTDLSSKLSPIEKYNIDMIQKFEKKLAE